MIIAIMISECFYLFGNFFRAVAYIPLTVLAVPASVLTVRQPLLPLPLLAKLVFIFFRKVIFSSTCDRLACIVA